MVAFAGAHVVVTGGTGALGSAVVGALRAAGAECHVTNFVAAELDRFPFKSDPAVHVATGIDLADEAAVRRFYEALPPLWASVHLAGGFAMAPVGETSGADFEAQFRMNALSCFLCSAAAVRSIRARRDGRKGGRIVNVSARPALEPRLGAGMAAYAASKAAVAALTQALGEELVGEDIWVNAVAPSILDTPANRAAMPGAPHERWVAPAAIAALIAFLASPDNRVTRGAVVPVYGGS
ncbi:MAG TPA: SDR family NAD(P)-dependent oxidoreductase [Stellaceae bacterium]|nr:SDR family NAD(P)-dependent oxidoreductase [Stellaceae bacterium]